MEPFQSSNTADFTKKFVILGMIFLLSTLVLGLVGALEYIFPGLLKDFFSFEKNRPMHVSAAIFWILSAALGSVLYFLKEHNHAELKHENLVKLMFYILGFTFVIILITYAFGIFGGREYWEFHPALSIPITVGWSLFIFVFLSNFKSLKNQPIYIWMWFTGAVFFLFTYLESNLWLIPEVRNHLVKDMTIQWKSYGSLVGSWNMLIYGSSIYLMDKISGNKKYSFSNIAFWIFFLGLFNLMFNWGHHIYTLPTQPYVKHIGYLVSMTELLLFGRIIYLWKSSLDTAKKFSHIESYRFLLAADVWVFLNLGLAIAMSVPAINLYMHGTHVVVGHTMGATIGINSMLLLAFIANIFGKNKTGEKTVKTGFWLLNISLFVFWIMLITTGFIKTYWMHKRPDFIYTELINNLRPYFYVFFVSGLVMTIGFVMIIFSLLKRAVAKIANTDKQ